MVCPITNTDKKHAFHIPLERTQTTGVILVDQARILDINARNFQFIERLPPDIMDRIKNLLISFVE
jgi:mRNA interferase MazF